MHPCACVSGRWPFWLYCLAPSLLCQRHVRVSSCADDFSCSWHVRMFFSAKHCIIWSTQNLALLCCRFIFMRMLFLLPMRRVPIYPWVVRYVAQTGIRLHARHLNPPQSGTWQSVMALLLFLFSLYACKHTKLCQFNWKSTMQSSWQLFHHSFDLLMSWAQLWNAAVCIQKCLSKCT